jgi:hypothetical protein
MGKEISFKTAKLLSHFDYNQKSSDDGYVIATGELSSDYSIDLMNANAIAAPTQSDLQTWLRDTHNISVEVNLIRVSSSNTSGSRFTFEVFQLNELHIMIVDSTPLGYLKYEDALEEGLYQTLQIL